MGVSILTLLDSDLRQEKLTKIGLSDFYLAPEYAELCGYTEHGKSSCFVFEEEDKVYLYPFRLRTLPEAVCQLVGTAFFDLTSDYGYGGPVANTSEVAFLTRANNAFCDFCCSQKVITEFVRFHPLLDNAKTFRSFYDVIPLNETVIVDLADPAKFWQGLRKGHRSDINKSIRLGVTVRFAETEADWIDFKDIYFETMKTLAANDYYFFSDSYFEFLRGLKSNVFVLLANYEGKPVAAACFFYDGRFLHYHLSGLLREFTSLGANKRLLYEAFQIAKTRGIHKAHLGGGVGGSNADPLMSFKSGFSDLRGQFCVAKKVHDEVTYNAICERLSLQILKSGYFPRYRDPAVLQKL